MGPSTGFNLAQQLHPDLSYWADLRFLLRDRRFERVSNRLGPQNDLPRMSVEIAVRRQGPCAYEGESERNER